MTLPVERTRAVLWTQEEGLRLHNAYYSSRRQYVRIPAEEWERFVRHLTRHYPSRFELSETARQCPEIWGMPDERD